MKVQKQSVGVTLLEVMLVLVVATSLLILALRTYYLFRFQAQEQQIAYTVDQTFRAMTGFYQANCRQTLDQDATPQSEGALDPLVTDVSGIPEKIVLSLKDTLITPGFIRLVALRLPGRSVDLPTAVEEITRSGPWPRAPG